MTFTFKHVCTNILGISLKFTSKIEEFIAHDGMKISYGKQQMGSEFFIQQTDLLLEQGITDVDIHVDSWEGVPCFFKLSDHSDLPFDIFAASFYLLSRYEEYQPYVKDESGHYPYQESLAYKEGFLSLPVVDIWAYKWNKILKKQFPKTVFPTQHRPHKNLIAVSQAFLYQNKGVMRTFGGSVRDLCKLKIRSLFERFQVLVFRKKDPYDVYDELVRFYKKYGIDFHFMFQLSDYSMENINIGYHKKKYQSLIKSMADYFDVGLLLGDQALLEAQVLRTEKKRFESIVNVPLESVMNNRFPINLPDTYNQIDKFEIQHDFSMGYTHQIGFRAGTSVPFLYYDLSLERISPMRIHPYIFNSLALQKIKLNEVRSQLTYIRDEVRKVSGSLCLVFELGHFSTENNKRKLLELIQLVYEHE